MNTRATVKPGDIFDVLGVWYEFVEWRKTEGYSRAVLKRLSDNSTWYHEEKAFLKMADEF